MKCWDHQICSSTMAMPLTYSVWPDKIRASLFFHLRLYELVFTKPCIASHGTFFKSGCVFPSRRPWLISVALILLLFSRQVMSNSLQPHGLQHTRLHCLSPTRRVYSDFWSIESVMPSNHLILCCPFLLLPSIFPSIRVFSNDSVLCITWPKFWSFGFSISPSNEYSELISFRIDWFDLAVQGILKSLHQCHNSKA